MIAPFPFDGKNGGGGGGEEGHHAIVRLLIVDNTLARTHIVRNFHVRRFRGARGATACALQDR